MKKILLNLSVFIGAISLLIIYYKLGAIALFCTVGGLMVGSLVEKAGWN